MKFGGQLLGDLGLTPFVQPPCSSKRNEAGTGTVRNLLGEQSWAPFSWGWVIPGAHSQHGQAEQGGSFGGGAAARLRCYLCKPHLKDAFKRPIKHAGFLIH